MKHPSLYLDWYIHVPPVKYDLRSSGVMYFRCGLNLDEVDLSVNYAYGNPETVKQVAKWYSTRRENIFVSSEGASGQNARIIRCLAERNPLKKEAIVEYPTYEPLLRATQEHFPRVRRLERQEKEAYVLDADRLRKMVSERTGLLVLTNPHAPSGVISDTSQLKEVMSVAKEHDFYVLCDEIYAEFDRNVVPTLFSVDPAQSVVTTSFTKAYGLGGLKLGIALAGKERVDDLYRDVLNTVGNSPNVVQLAAAKLLARDKTSIQRHMRKWIRLKKETEEWLSDENLEHFPNKVGVTYWIKLPINDTCRWMNDTIPRYGLAAVPGAFFMFKNGYKLEKSNMARLGLGAINPDSSDLTEALGTLVTALKG